MATLIALVAQGLSHHPLLTVMGKHPIDSVSLAILLALAVSNAVNLPIALQPGIDWAVKSVLAAGIVLMGARLDIGVVASLGRTSLGLVIGLVALALCVGWVLARAFSLPWELGALTAVGCTICGGSAIQALAPVLKAERRDVSCAIAIITFVGLVALFGYPRVAFALGLGDTALGWWAGLSIPNTPQVIAAGLTVSSRAAEVATTVKMVRNCFILPVVIGFAFIVSRRASVSAQACSAVGKALPGFVLGFLALSLVRTVAVQFGWIGSASLPGPLWPAMTWIETVSTTMLTVAMAGIGLTTKLSELVSIGRSALLVGALLSLSLALASLGLIRWFGLA